MIGNLGRLSFSRAVRNQDLRHMAPPFLFQFHCAALQVEDAGSKVPDAMPP